MSVTAPMTWFFAACSRVLDEQLVPMHYRELTASALEAVGMARADVDWQRQVEDVREKFAEAGRHGAAYLGSPLCLVVKRDWFGADQADLFPATSIYIDGNATAGLHGAFEALMRDEFMKQKTRAPKESVRLGRARGLVIQAHVAEWFAARWPLYYRAADNEGRWSEWCAHDFKLHVRGRTYLVDVSGRTVAGEYGNHGGKTPVDLHLLCDFADDCVSWDGVVRGRDFVGNVPPTKWTSPARMVAWLNCERAGLDYQALATQIRRAAA